MNNKALVAALLLSSACLIQAAPIVAYDYPSLATAGGGANFGNQSFGQALGMDFNVNQAITIFSLGAFDSGQDGYQSTITVQLFNRDTQLAVSPLITMSSSDTLINGGRFQTLATALNLAAGFHGTIVAYGYSASEFNGNVNSGGTFNPASLNNLGGAITFQNTASFGGFGYPSTSFVGATNQFGAGSFTFDLTTTSTTPEPATLGMIGVGILAMGGVARSRRRKS